jgi:hypothetical protein
MSAVAQSSSRLKRWTVWSAAGLGVLLIAVGMIPLPEHPRGTIVNSNPAFQLQSLSITRGTNHVLIYPDKLRYWGRQAYSALGFWGQVSLEVHRVSASGPNAVQ